MLSANFVIILGIGKNYNYFCGSVVLISVVLALLRKAWKWGKFFRLDELPEFNRSVLEVTHSCASVMLGSQKTMGRNTRSEYLAPVWMLQEG